MCHSAVDFVSFMYPMHSMLTTCQAPLIRLAQKHLRVHALAEACFFAAAYHLGSFFVAIWPAPLVAPLIIYMRSARWRQNLRAKES